MRLASDTLRWLILAAAMLLTLAAAAIVWLPRIPDVEQQGISERHTRLFDLYHKRLVPYAEAVGHAPYDPAGANAALYLLKEQGTPAEAFQIPPDTRYGPATRRSATQPAYDDQARRVADAEYHYLNQPTPLRPLDPQAEAGAVCIMIEKDALVPDPVFALFSDGGIRRVWLDFLGIEDSSTLLGRGYDSLVVPVPEGE